MISIFNKKNSLGSIDDKVVIALIPIFSFCS